MSKSTDKSTESVAVMFGIGDDKKPRAARFNGSQHKLLTQAAEAMDPKLCVARAPEVAEIANRLPVGRLYANGRGFVPFVRHQLYATLTAALAAAGEYPAGSDGPPGLPRSWDKIDVGHLVLASGGAGNGWWEAIVVDVNGDLLTLHWRDFPWEPDFVQHRAAMALIKPTA